MQGVLSHILAGALIAVTQPGSGPSRETPQPQADHRLVANLCAAVEAQTAELEPKHDIINYQYQTLVANAAGVLPTDDRVTFNQKAREWLNTNMERLLCGQFNFTPNRGNILKLAIASKADPFINDVLLRWRVDLNQEDAVDGKTVLDYIEQLRVEAGTNARLIRTYSRYYDRFRAAGAKHGAELRP